MPARSADQKPPEAGRFGNEGWSIFISVRFMPNRECHAPDIVRKGFMPARRKAGDSPLMALVHRTGQRSASVMGTSQNVTGILAWAMDPTNSTSMHARG